MDRMQVVIAGAGVAGLETALAVRRLAEERVTIEVVSPAEEFVYKPLAVAEPFRMGEARHVPLRAFAAEFAGDLRHAAVARVDPEEKRITLADGEHVGYEVFVAALGAQVREAVVGALTYRGVESGSELTALLERAVTGELSRIMFAVPAATAWALPNYELALMTREFLSEHGTRRVSVGIATPEDRPLTLFGEEASSAIAELLTLREIDIVTGVAPRAFQDGHLLTSSGTFEADAVVALPALTGPMLEGLPRDGRGFVPTNEFGEVSGLTDVYAVGDMTQFPVKQGGIAAQQADAAASAIAADAGAPIEPAPFVPVLRGILLTGLVPRYLRAEPSRGKSEADTEPLWWPPAKVVGRHLAPFLASHFGVPSMPPGNAGIEIDVELDRHGCARTPV